MLSAHVSGARLVRRTISCLRCRRLRPASQNGKARANRRKSTDAKRELAWGGAGQPRLLPRRVETPSVVAAGVPRAARHDLRASFASWLLDEPPNWRRNTSWTILWGHGVGGIRRSATEVRLDRHQEPWGGRDTRPSGGTLVPARPRAKRGHVEIRDGGGGGTSRRHDGRGVPHAAESRRG